MLNNNCSNVNPNQIKIININNNDRQITPGKNKLFKNIKLYEIKKKQNYIKKRNSTNKKKNKIPCFSFTDINPDLKKTFSNNFDMNNNSTNLNNKINLYKKNIHSNKNIKNNRSLPKSKSNKVFFTPFQNYNIHSRNKNLSNALLKSTSNSGYLKSYNNSNNKKAINPKIHKYQTNFSPLYMNHTISVSSQKPNKLNENKAKGRSLDSSVEDKIKIQKLIKEKDNKDKEIKYKEKIIKEQENIIKILKQKEIQMKEHIKIINIKYEDLKEKYQKMINENKILNDILIENDKNIHFLKEKELKLMRILYLIKEKGIDINSILNEMKNESNNESINSYEISNDSNLTNSSNVTIYFPDKINMKKTMETKGADKVPKIDFNQIPDYSFQSDEDKKNNEEELLNKYIFDFPEITFNKYVLNGFRQNSA